LPFTSVRAKIGGVGPLHGSQEAVDELAAHLAQGVALIDTHRETRSNQADEELLPRAENAQGVDQGVSGQPHGMSVSGTSAVRKLMHLTLAWLPALGWYVSFWLELGLAIVLLAASLVLERARRRWGWVNRLLWQALPSVFREWEHRRVLGSTWFSAGSLAALLLFDLDIGSTAILCCSWGDSAAEVAGRWWRRTQAGRGRTLPPGKTMAGSLACLLACAIAGIVGVTLGGLSPWSALVGAVVATLVERWSPPPDDNLWIPVLSGLAMWAVQALT
jgi:dolichol kinase